MEIIRNQATCNNGLPPGDAAPCDSINQENILTALRTAVKNDVSSYLDWGLPITHPASSQVDPNSTHSKPVEVPCTSSETVQKPALTIPMESSSVQALLQHAFVEALNEPATAQLGTYGPFGKALLRSRTVSRAEHLIQQALSATKGKNHE